MRHTTTYVQTSRRLGVFLDCTELTSLTLSSKMTKFWWHNVVGCTSLTEILVADGSEKLLLQRRRAVQLRRHTSDMLSYGQNGKQLRRSRRHTQYRNKSLCRSGAFEKRYRSKHRRLSRLRRISEVGGHGRCVCGRRNGRLNLRRNRAGRQHFFQLQRDYVRVERA